MSVGQISRNRHLILSYASHGLMDRMASSEDEEDLSSGQQMSVTMSVVLPSLNDNNVPINRRDH